MLYIFYSIFNGQKGDCKEIISKKYKFYFAFESSLCKDYVTEKFFEILPYDIIPVVYGYGSYSTYVPKSGFINALDYPPGMEWNIKYSMKYFIFHSIPGFQCTDVTGKKYYTTVLLNYQFLH